ncbi:hypothetical protein C7974DRAFT_317813, partial [Boeremia exigua]|uniref:uncharacterized protein n=1 Tax=Boeremia exigua TaxID=749465 RepID=UPI001E8EDD0C
MAHFLGHDAVDHSNLSESETDDYIPSVFENDDLFAINKTATKYLNYTNQYVPKWEGSEALSEFTTEYTEHQRTILIRAFTPGTAKLLGFIRFAYDREGFSIGGGLKIANFNASLQGSMLRTGGTTKHEGSGQTGQFGEGLKLSALVFRRLGYKFHIESTGFKWNFIYQQHELACKLSRIPDMKLKVGQDSTRGLARTTDAHAWEDVCVVIGA